MRKTHTAATGSSQGWSHTRISAHTYTHAHTKRIEDASKRDDESQVQVQVHACVKMCVREFNPGAKDLLRHPVTQWDDGELPLSVKTS